MKLTLERDALVAALAHVAGAVERKTTIPILSCFRLEASGAALHITGTNLDVEATASAKAEIAAPGVVAVPADVLAGFAKKLPSGAPVTLEQDDGQLRLAAGRARLAIPLFPAADFPVMGDAPGDVTFALDSPLLARLLAQSRFACSTEETRYYLCGVLIQARATEDGSRLAFVATDGHRLAYAETEAPSALAAAALNAIVPRHSVALIAKLIAGDMGETELSFDASHIVVRSGDCVLKSKLIDGSFPDYQRVIPHSAPNTLTLSRQGAAEALSRALIVAPDRSNAVRLDIGKEGAAFRVRNPDRGESNEEIGGDYKGKPVEIGFNGKLLADALAQSSGENVVFELGDATAPALVRDPGVPGVLAVLMPLRV